MPKKATVYSTFLKRTSIFLKQNAIKFTSKKVSIVQSQKLKIQRNSPGGSSAYGWVYS